MNNNNNNNNNNKANLNKSAEEQNFAIITHQNAKKYIFQIKSYQRTFVWDVKKIKKLEETIRKNIFFGVGTCIETGMDEGRTVLEIIDGQQRLISLAMLFGGNIKFKFQFTDSKCSSLINKIINAKSIKSLEGVKEPKRQFNEELFKGYIEHLYELKFIIIKNREPSKKTISKPLEQFSMPFFIFKKVFKKNDTTTWDIALESFIRMNRFTHPVEVQDFFNAAFVRSLKKEVNDNNSDNDEGTDTDNFTTRWKKIYDSFFILQKRLDKWKGMYKKTIKFSELFVQAFNALLGTHVANKFITINKKRWYPKELTVDVFNSLDNYLKWAKENLKGWEEPDDFNEWELENIAFRDNKMKISSWFIIITYKITTYIKKKYHKNILLSLLHTIKCLFTYTSFQKKEKLVAEIIIKKINEFKIDREKTKVNNLDKAANTIFDELKNFFNKRVKHLTYESLGNWEHFLHNNGLKENNIKTKFFLIYFNSKLLLKEKIKKNLKELEDEFNFWNGKNWTLEHILNNEIKYFNNLNFYTLMEHKLNEKLKNLSLLEKIKKLEILKSHNTSNYDVSKRYVDHILFSKDIKSILEQKINTNFPESNNDDYTKDKIEKDFETLRDILKSKD